MGRLAMIEIDRLMLGERLRSLHRKGVKPSHLRGVERFRQKHRTGNGAGEGAD